jgi:hypothetical protein
LHCQSNERVTLIECLLHPATLARRLRPSHSQYQALSLYNAYRRSVRLPSNCQLLLWRYKLLRDLSCVTVTKILASCFVHHLGINHVLSICVRLLPIPYAFHHANLVLNTQLANSNFVTFPLCSPIAFWARSPESCWRASSDIFLSHCIDLSPAVTRLT